MLSIDKLLIIQDALRSCGHKPAASADDMPDEYEVADSGFRRAIGFALNKGNWNFATVSAPLGAPLAVSPSPKDDFAYQPPGDCIHILSVWDSNRLPIVDYEIVGGKICTSNSDARTVKYLKTPEPESTSPLFVEALTLYVEAAILRGLNEDFSEADRREAKAEMRLSEAAARTDQQNPRRNMRVSNLLSARRSRRG